LNDDTFLQADLQAEVQAPAPFTESESLVPPSDAQPKRFLPALLLLLTFLSTLVAGFSFHVHFVTDYETNALAELLEVWDDPAQILLGLPFALTILIILLAHEMGHYLACRYYGIEATLPYAIPAPPILNPFGTFGAVIRIKSAFRDPRQLFDVGIAGPLGGFIFIIPALIIGLQNSKEFVFQAPVNEAWKFGEPLLFQWAATLFYTGSAGSTISLHPIGWAAWFGLLATSLNLLPIGQLDGGHIVYALFGTRGHRAVSYVTFVGLVLISLMSWPMLGYLLFAVIIVFLGFRHPPPRTELPPLGQGRWILAILGLLIFLLSFIPLPIQLVSHVGRL